MRLAAVVVVVLVPAAFALAQLSPEEAYQKMRQKEKERQARAATQPAPTTRPSGMQIGRLAHEGWSHLMDHEYQQGLAIFERLIKADHKDANALEGAGICLYETEQYKQASKDLDQAVELSHKDASRQRIVAAALAALMSDNSMRTVRLVRERMQALEQNDKYDEEFQNILGAALWRASPQAQKLPYFEESLKYYLAYDKKLAKQKGDREMRWGIRWLPRAEAEMKWKQYDQATAAERAAAANFDHASLAAQHAKNNYDDLHDLALHSDHDVAMYTREYKQALRAQSAARFQLQRAQDHASHVEAPPFPAKFEPNWQEPG